jgi:hypothetical protein
MQLLDSRFSCHKYSSLRIQEWGIQYVYREQTDMVRLVQHQHGDPWQKLAWDPRIAGLRISFTDGVEWTLIGEISFGFPLSFIVEESMSLEGDSWRSCSTSLFIVEESTSLEGDSWRSCSTSLFIVEESTSLEGDSWRSCSTSLWQQHG